MVLFAFRSLWARKIRSALTALGVATCVLALTTVDGMLGHMHAERAQDVARFSDRVLLQPRGAGYPPFRSMLRQEWVATVLQRPDIVTDKSTPLLLLVLEPADNPMDVAGVIGLGLWPGREQAWIGDVQAISGRATLAEAGANAVILGAQAAHFYGVSAAGETVTLAGREWHVAGILRKAGPAKLDTVDNLVIMPLAEAQAIPGVEGWVSAVLLTAERGQAPTLAHSLREAYSTLEVYTQDDVRRVLTGELDLPGRFLGMLSWATFIIAVLLVTNVMSIAVRERAQEVAPIRPIGERRWAILGYTLTESLMLSLSGGILGMLAAVPTAYLLGWTWILAWGEGLRLTGLVLASGLLAGVYPAYHAVRLYPEVLRYDELRRQMEEIAAEKRAMDQAYRHLVRGREEERERLARELHDQAIQSLVGLKFHLAEQAPGAQTGLQAEIDAVIQTLRSLCADLRPPALDRLGLVAALRSYLDDFSIRTGIRVELRVEGDEQRLAPEVELTLFRVAQEALTNVWKHAQAPKVEVGLRFGEEGVELIVRDRGRGFVVPERWGTLAGAGHFGLVGMYERMALVGGTLRLASAPGQGTTVTAWVR